MPAWRFWPCRPWPRIGPRSRVDERLKFLPHGMVLHLQRLLADGRIDDYEREHFLAALRDQTSLTPAQRSEVARVIDGWFARDSTATA